MTNVARWTRVVLAGLVLGLALSFAVVARAQQVDGQSLPVVTALQAVAAAAGVGVIVADVPAIEVWIPQRSGDWLAVLEAIGGALGLEVCEISPGTWLVSGAPGAGVVCAADAEEEVGHEEFVAPVPGAVAPVGPASSEVEQAAEILPVEVVAPVVEALGLRLRVVQIDERRALELGINWRGGVFATAGAILGAGQLIAGGVIPGAVFDRIVSFLETEGVALRLEDVSLATIAGVPVAFNRGGSLNVTLARETSVERSFSYGLGLTVTPERLGDVFLLAYRFDDSSPGATSPELIELAATTSRGSVLAGCGETVVLASSVTMREVGEGAGLPVAASVPGLGYLAGSRSDRVTLGSFVITLEPLCAA